MLLASWRKLAWQLLALEVGMSMARMCAVPAWLAGGVYGMYGIKNISPLKSGYAARLAVRAAFNAEGRPDACGAHGRNMNNGHVGSCRIITWRRLLFDEIVSMSCAHRRCAPARARKPASPIVGGCSVVEKGAAPLGALGEHAGAHAWLAFPMR